MTEDISWVFHGYVTPAGGRDVQDWFDSVLNEEERDEAKDTIGYLRILPLHLWMKPEYSQLGEGLSELRFKVNSLNRIYRVYGFFWPKGRRHCYTFLLGRAKKVKNAQADVAEARKRKVRVENGKAKIHEFEFAKESDIEAPSKPAGA